MPLEKCIFLYEYTFAVFFVSGVSNSLICSTSCVVNTTQCAVVLANCLFGPCQKVICLKCATRVLCVLYLFGGKSCCCTFVYSIITWSIGIVFWRFHDVQNEEIFNK